MMSSAGSSSIGPNSKSPSPMGGAGGGGGADDKSPGKMGGRVVREIPPLGFGTYDISPESVHHAVMSGFRHFDCACSYGNEKRIGLVLKADIETAAISREELFLTSKYPHLPTDMDDLRSTVDKSLADMQTDYFDLYLIHHPGGWTKDTLAEAWGNMLQLKEKGKVIEIGVSNFYPNAIRTLMDICKENGWEPPYINQIETHLYDPETELIELCEASGVRVAAHTPLGGLASKILMQNPTIKKIAEEQAETLGKPISPSQVILAWEMKRGLSVIPKSNTPEHIIENFHTSEIELSIAQFDEINAVARDSLGFPFVGNAQDQKIYDDSHKS